MKRLLFIPLLLLSLSVKSQLPAQPDRVFILIADSAYAITKETTQTETKPGWKIVDIQTHSRTTRYLWGSRAKQIADSRRPRFIIDPEQYQLTDFVIIRLKAKRSYRKFPKADFTQCDFRRVGLDWMHITLLSDERYCISPISAMEPGEYVLLCLASPAVNDLGDVEVYPFTIPEK